MGEIVRYKHSVNSGDLIASMPGMKYVYDELGKKAVIMQRMGLRADYQGQRHPLMNDEGQSVCMTPKQWEMLKPLLLSQEYIEGVEIWEGQEYDIDFDRIREGEFTTMPFGSINRWVWYAFPLLSCDLSKPWLSVDKVSGYEDKVIVNLTERYRNPLITYFFLKKWEDKLIFAGTPNEHQIFCRDYKLSIPYLEVKDFLELAQIAASCKFVLCNQSMLWNICEAMKVKRVCEIIRQTSNCIPNGPNGYDYIQQFALETYMNKFMK